MLLEKALPARLKDRVVGVYPLFLLHSVQLLFNTLLLFVQALDLKEHKPGSQSVSQICSKMQVCRILLTAPFLFVKDVHRW